MVDDMSQNLLNNILDHCQVIAVVGVSDDSTKPSFQVASYLKRCGYRIIPVNPNANSVLGEKSYSSIHAIPPRIAETIDVVDVFRKSQDVAPVVEQAIELKKRYRHLMAVWMQPGVVNETAAEAARQVGLDVVMDNCIMHTHNMLKRNV
jgi:predicted CoA-binding protein